MIGQGRYDTIIALGMQTIMCGMRVIIMVLSAMILHFLFPSGDEIRRVMMEAIIPLVTGVCMKRRARERLRGGDGHGEVFLSVYDQFDDYLEMVVQFGVSPALDSPTCSEGGGGGGGG